MFFESSGIGNDSDAAAQRGGDVYQCRQGKARDPAAEQIVDPRLRHAAMACRFDLGPVMALHKGRNLPHQFGPRPQARGLPGRVRDGLSNAGVTLRFAHFPPPDNSANRLRAVSILRFDFACVFV